MRSENYFLQGVCLHHLLTSRTVNLDERPFTILAMSFSLSLSWSTARRERGIIASVVPCSSLDRGLQRTAVVFQELESIVTSIVTFPICWSIMEVLESPELVSEDVLVMIY